MELLELMLVADRWRRAHRVQRRCHSPFAASCGIRVEGMHDFQGKAGAGAGRGSSLRGRVQAADWPVGSRAESIEIFIDWEISELAVRTTRWPRRPKY
jgi:hypothetical protein